MCIDLPTPGRASPNSPSILPAAANIHGQPRCWGAGSPQPRGGQTAVWVLPILWAWPHLSRWNRGVGHNVLPRTERSGEPHASAQTRGDACGHKPSPSSKPELNRGLSSTGGKGSPRAQPPSRRPSLEHRAGTPSSGSDGPPASLAAPWPRTRTGPSRARARLRRGPQGATVLGELS